MTTNDMSIHWLWPYAAVAAVLVAAVLVAVISIFRGRRRPPRDGMPVYSLDDDLNTEHASHLFHLWRLLGRIAVAALVAALAICTVLIARPAHVDRDAERSSSRDIVLCLDVSGSALPYDRAVIETYLELVSHFQGERIALSIFNSTSRTVFPLTDDYDLVSSQLTKAADALRGVESQDDIDKLSDKDSQKIADWLEGTHISVDGLFSGPRQSEGDATTTEMKQQIESRGGTFLTQSGSSDINELVRQIDSRRTSESRRSSQAALIDAPGWWTLMLVVLLAIWMILAWRLRR